MQHLNDFSSKAIHGYRRFDGDGHHPGVDSEEGARMESRVHPALPTRPNLTCRRLILYMAVAFLALAALLTFFWYYIPCSPQEEKDYLIAEFASFKERFNKSYSSDAEEKRRLAIFSTNHGYIQRLNVENAHKGVQFGVNHFSDMDGDELKKFVMPPSYMASLHSSLPLDPADTLPAIFNRPSAWDWRRHGIVTHVKNQQQCGSCWAFATAAVVESQCALSQLRANKTITRATLSEQQLIDCDTADNGCDGGWRPNAFNYVKGTGLVGDNKYPYIGKADQCRVPADYRNDRKPDRVYVDRVVGLPADEDRMATYLVEKGPVSIGVMVTKEMFSYRSGVFDPTPEDCATKTVGSHAMEVVGYGEQRRPDGSTVDYWILKNSWGSSYGINGGYLQMRRGVDACGLARTVYTALIN